MLNHEMLIRLPLERQQAIRAEARAYWFGREAQKSQPKGVRRPRRPQWWPALRPSRLLRARSGECTDAA